MIAEKTHRHSFTIGLTFRPRIPKSASTFFTMTKSTSTHDSKSAERKLSLARPSGKRNGLLNQ